jgi:SAM-dependent methyltransferase
MTPTSGLSVQFGCGIRAPEEWLNFDISPTLSLSRIPGLTRLLHLPHWPPHVRKGDIVKGLPIPDASCARLYCDQVLEHLTRDELTFALQNCRRHLAPDGVFRLFLPDLGAMATAYTQMTTPDAAHWLMESTGLGLQSHPKTIPEKIRALLGHSRHQWGWDHASMTAALQDAGFTTIRPVSYRDTSDPLFQLLEGPIQWDPKLVLGLEARP